VNTNQGLKHKHGHMLWVGFVGAAAGAVLMIYVPSLKPVSSVLLLFAGFHLVGAAVLIASLYVMSPRGIVARLLPTKRFRGEAGFDFGWAPAWKYGPWIAATILGAGVIAIQVVAPAYWPIALVLTLFAASFFAGGLITQMTGRYEHALPPTVDLLSAADENKVVLDAGCGAGRTSIALVRALTKTRIVALDRFDSGYIEGGGQRLLEQNLLRAGMGKRTQVQVGDLTALPFPDRSFDAAVSAHAVDHLGQLKQQGLTEILRVLKPGGRFLLVVWVPSWAMFAIGNALSLSLAPKRALRRMAANAGFVLSDEGTFNGSWFALLQKPEA